jgi:uncharacterized protein (DUF924 family)
MTSPVEVLDFWLGEIGPDGWFNGGDAVDDACRDRFGDTWAAARDLGLEHWVDGTAGTLAYLVVTDQFPRNMFRGKPEAFSTDPQALAAARRAVDAGWDLGAPERERSFFYLPFTHSEVMADQDLCVALTAERLPDSPDHLLHARAHRDVILRFGRFPFRNAALGRDTTPAEQAFLDAGAYPALVAELRASHAKDA